MAPLRQRWVRCGGWGRGLGKFYDGGTGNPGFGQRRTGFDGHLDQSGRAVRPGIGRAGGSLGKAGRGLGKAGGRGERGVGHRLEG